MTNKIESVYEYVKAALQTAGVANVLRIPDDIQMIGNYYPMALLQEGVQNYIIDAGQRHIYELTFTIYLCTDVVREQSKYMNDLQALIFNELFKTSTMGGIAMNVNPISVDPGASNPISNAYISAGYNEAAQIRRIDINVKLQDVRI